MIVFLPILNLLKNLMLLRTTLRKALTILEDEGVIIPADMGLVCLLIQNHSLHLVLNSWKVYPQ